MARPQYTQGTFNRENVPWVQSSDQPVSAWSEQTYENDSVYIIDTDAALSVYTLGNIWYNGTYGTLNTNFNNCNKTWDNT